MQYLDIPKREQNNFLKEAKDKLQLTWKDFASFLGVNRSMIYFYANGSSHLPLKSYIFICNKINRQLDIVPTIEISNKIKNLNFPIFCEKLAEFLGILAGDGHINDESYEVSVALDKNSDKEYSRYVECLFTELFGFKPAFFHQNNVTRIKTYSKSLVSHLAEVFGRVNGGKVNKLHIPQIVWDDKKYLSAFLRGVFDTDGSFHRHRKNDAVVEFTSCDKPFLQEIVKALDILGFRASSSGKNIYIYAKQDIKRFFEIVGSSNPKNLKKYQYFLFYGWVPLSSEALTL